MCIFCNLEKKVFMGQLHKILQITVIINLTTLPLHFSCITDIDWEVVQREGEIYCRRKPSNGIVETREALEGGVRQVVEVVMQVVQEPYQQGCLEVWEDGCRHAVRWIHACKTFFSVHQLKCYSSSFFLKQLRLFFVCLQSCIISWYSSVFPQRSFGFLGFMLWWYSAMSECIEWVVRGKIRRVVAFLDGVIFELFICKGF